MSKKLRQQRVIERLQSQLKAGIKTGFVWNDTKTTLSIAKLPLEEKDVKRIKKEIEILKLKVS